MLKTTTRIYTGAVMAALLVGVNTGAFACEGCVEAPAKTGVKAAKTTKPVAKTLASAKIAPKMAPKAAAKAAPKAAKKSAVKLASLETGARGAVKMCPMCEEKAAAKK